MTIIHRVKDTSTYIDRWDMSFTKCYIQTLKLTQCHACNLEHNIMRHRYCTILPGQYYSYSNLLELVRSITCAATCIYMYAHAISYTYVHVHDCTSALIVYACANGQSISLSNCFETPCQDRDKTVGQLKSRSFLCVSLSLPLSQMNSVIYAWLCSLTVAFGGFMWGYEVG